LRGKKEGKVGPGLIAESLSKKNWTKKFEEEKQETAQITASNIQKTCQELGVSLLGVFYEMKTTQSTMEAREARQKDRLGKRPGKRKLNSFLGENEKGGGSDENTNKDWGGKSPDWWLGVGTKGNGLEKGGRVFA